MEILPQLEARVNVYGGQLQNVAWQHKKKSGSYAASSFRPIDLMKAFHRLVNIYSLTYNIEAHASQAWNEYMFITARDEGTISVEVHVDYALSLKRTMDGVEQSQLTTVKWFNLDCQNGIEETTFTLTGNFPPDAFYPWMTTSIKEFGRDFLASGANVLILLGAPGTGKTSFIRGLISSMEAETWLTYDEKLQSDDRLFIKFMKPSVLPRALVLEDADVLLSSRTDGNKLMGRLLNLSDGIVVSGTRKLIFSTNLPNIRSVDDALFRPGRCYGVLHFRDLEKQEAIRACAAVGKEMAVEIGAGERVTLSVALNGRIAAPTVKRLGFNHG